jgi:hypothetical protein
MNKMMGKTHILIVIAVSLIISCSQPKSAWKGSIEEIDGVTVVKNPKEPIYGEDVLTLEEDLVIGGGVDEVEPVFLSVRTFKIDDEENIYVLDNKAHKIKVFNKTGQLIKEFGKKGPGPGELDRPSNIELYSEDQLIVFNMRGRKMSLFSRNGEFIKDLPMEKYGGISRIRVDSQGSFYGYSMIRGESSRKIKVDKFDSNLNLVSNIVTMEKKIDYYSFEAIPTFLYFHVINDNFVWGYASKYVLHIVDPDGNEVRRISREYDPVELTKKEKERIAKEFSDMPSRFKLKIPDAHPPFDWFYPGIDGGIVVRTHEITAEESHYFDFFDSEGRYIAKVPFKFLPRAWKNNKVYFAEEDEEGYQLIKRYRAIWKY